MKKYILTAVVAFFTLSIANAQKSNNQKTQQLADLSFGFGSKQGSVVAGYFYNWNLGKNRKFFIGTGARFNTFYGTGVNFTSAPSNLAGDKLKEDTLFAPKPNIFSFNILINLGYNITPKLQAGFSIDAIGASFGPEGTPSFISNGFATSTKAKPTSFNALLIGNNDRGSLNSEFYARYKITEKFGVKLAYQYLFNELTTNTKVQTTPEANDRFRSKASLVNIGFSYHF
jgi:long-subunit fatty acid transport protein